MHFQPLALFCAQQLTVQDAAGGDLKQQQTQESLFDKQRRVKRAAPTTLVLQHAEKANGAGFTSEELKLMLNMSGRVAKKSIRSLLWFSRILKQNDERGVPLFRNSLRVYVLPQYFNKGEGQ